MSQNAKGAALSLLAFALYATHDAVVKLLGEDYSPFQLIFYSTLFSFPLAMGMMMRDPQPVVVPVLVLLGIGAGLLASQGARLRAHYQRKRVVTRVAASSQPVPVQLACQRRRSRRVAISVFVIGHDR